MEFAIPPQAASEAPDLAAAVPADGALAEADLEASLRAIDDGQITAPTEPAAAQSATAESAEPAPPGLSPGVACTPATTAADSTTPPPVAAASAASAPPSVTLAPVAPAALAPAARTRVVATRVPPLELPSELAYLRDLDCAQLWALLDEEQTKVTRWLLWGEGPTWAAQKTGVARSKIYRWKAEPLFTAVYELLKRHKLAEIHDNAQMLGSRAIRALAAGLDIETPKSAKLALELLKELGMFKRQE
ncbi:MAG TPA: hypothetical protein VLI90_18965 [Tepidisphaeraceae bacterium]|nr:hypothetical protein [Tepidisphaeraceae bacterium]